MSSERVQGLAAAYALLGAVPDGARHELADSLGRAGRDILADQQATVAKASGALRSGLESQLETEKLRVRVGLVGTRQRISSSGSRAYKDLFYGRVVEGGRRAQTVTVTRRLKRKVRGNGTTSRRRVVFTGKAYTMKVAALAARPFVHTPRAQDKAIARVADYWSAVLSKAGAA